MPILIKIKGKSREYRTRSEQEDYARAHGLQGLDQEQYEKVKWLEKKYGKGFWSERESSPIGSERGGEVEKELKRITNT